MAEARPPTGRRLCAAGQLPALGQAEGSRSGSDRADAGLGRRDDRGEGQPRLGGARRAVDDHPRARSGADPSGRSGAGRELRAAEVCRIRSALERSEPDPLESSCGACPDESGRRLRDAGLSALADLWSGRPGRPRRPGLGHHLAAPRRRASAGRRRRRADPRDPDRTQPAGPRPGGGRRGPPIAGRPADHGAG